MAVELVTPAYLLLIPAGLAALWLLARRLPRGPRLYLAAALRALTIALVALALAAPTAVFTTRDSQTWLLVDRSDSMRGAADEVASAIARALGAAPADAAIGQIAFGRGGQVVAPLSAGRAPADAGLGPLGDDSALSEALSLAASLTPSSGRVAVISDGRVDDVAEQAELLAARGIPADVLHLAAPDLPDAQLTALRLPGELREGQSFEIEAIVHATSGGPATLALYANGAAVASRDVTLRVGENRFSFQDVAGTPGLVTYEARLVADHDGESRNNRQAGFSRVEGRAGALIVEGRPGEGAELEKMLLAASFQMQTVSPSRLPGTAEALRQYDAIVLANVDADDLTDDQIAALDTAVRTFGRGLLVTGGDQSYALGGYLGSALTGMLPLEMTVKGKLDMPSLALALVIDKSGSMTEGQFGVTRLELAKEAAMRACEVLTGEDSIGVIAFDDTAMWVVPMQPVDDVSAIQSKIGTIRPGGGTAYYGALNAAYQALASSDAAQKRVIFLSDGAPGDGGFHSIASSMAQRGITLTTVGVGTGANAQLL
ncbi:MAG: VWA domain-containing protein, partial [Clostridiales bacterium]|nr:VWA domain-containing protein [Clostridiales bacterium]